MSIDQPPFDTASPLHSNSKLNLYLLSTPPFYIPSLHTQHCRILTSYSSIAAGLPTGHKTTPPMTSPLWHSLSTLPHISSSPISLHSVFTVLLYLLSTPPFSSPVTRQPPIWLNPFWHSFWASHQSKAILFFVVMEFFVNVFYYYLTDVSFK